jgi:rhomboid protease GluP
MTDGSQPVIPARSRRQAMDWSLVLASQGIETAIGTPAEERGWHLIVARPDLGRALESLRLYRQENRARRWLHPLPGSDLVFDSSSGVWLVLLAAFYWIDAAQLGHLRAVGMVDSQAVQAGEWWRLFTALMLHADLAHLAVNVTTGFLLLGLAMGTLGAGLAMLGAYAAGVCGNVAGLWLYANPHRGLGASGMVLGALGLLTAQSIVFWRTGGAGKPLVVRGLLGGGLLLVLLGLSPNPQTDVIAHVAGFLGGLVLGAVIVGLPARWRHSRWTQRGAVLACLGLVLFTWWLALR